MSPRSHRRRSSSRRRSNGAPPEPIDPANVAGRAVRSPGPPHWRISAAVGLVLGVSVTVAFQPISGESLWWQMSRGREVLLGSLQPSAALLASETQRDADWLGGLPACVLYMLLEADGLMLGRLVIVTALALPLVAVLRKPATAARPHRAVGSAMIAGVAMPALSPVLDPLPMIFDLAGVAFLGWWLRLDRDRGLRRRTVAIGLLFLAWSNLSWGIASGSGMLLVAAVTSTVCQPASAARFRWWDVGVSLAAGSLNPRGVWAWVDSARLLVPAAIVSPAVVDHTPWAPLPRAAWGLPEVCLVGLTLVWILREGFATRRSGSEAGSTAGRLAPFFLMQILAWVSAANVPLAIAWLACDLIGEPRFAPQALQAAGGPRKSGVTAWRRGLNTALLSAGGLAVALILSSEVRSMGWGIDARLDNRLLQIALSETEPHGTAFADDVRSGGMLVWILPMLQDGDSGARPNGLRLQDVPSRALVGGRLEEHQQLLVDLRESRLTRYWREDGSAGGWWLPLSERNTALLCISRDRAAWVAALEPTLWKPLSLDSPVIPYAKAGDPAFMDRLVEVLRYRQLVDFGPWNYTLPTTSGSPFDRDLLGLRQMVGTAGASLQQARVFRAMGLHYAALRVLRVARDQWAGDPRLKEEVRRCQAELADAERLIAGQPSWLRQWAAQTVIPQQIGEDGKVREVLRHLVAVYLRDGPEAALRGAAESPSASQHPQIAYACVCWALESGQPDRAREIGRPLAKREIPAHLRLLVQARLKELGSLDEESVS